MSLSVIIPTLNESRYVGALLDSLANQALDCAYEVIVVDASDDRATVSAAERHRSQHDLRIMSSERADIGYQRNLGGRAARYDILLFVDADVLLDKDVIRHAMRRLRPSELGLVSVRHRPDRPSLAIYATLVMIYGLILLARLARLPVTNGGFLMTTARTFDAVDGFRQGYLLGEDTDFGYRAGKAGARHFLVWRASVTASSRRLYTSRPARLATTWARAYLRVIVGRGPSGRRTDDSSYPYGVW